MSRTLAFIAALAGALLIAALAHRPPTDPYWWHTQAASDISARLLATHIEAIGASPHATGSDEAQKVRGYLVQRLNRLGLQTELQTFEISQEGRNRLSQWGAPWADRAVGANVIGVLPGSDPSLRAVAVMAHYDTVWASPGAADDSAGVAAALEVARAALAWEVRRRDIVIILTDAEEISLGGSRAFFGAHPLAPRIGAVVNLEARGGGGRAIAYETSPGNGALMRRYAGRVRHPTSHSVAVLIYELMPNYTDFTEPKDRGLAGYNIAFMGRPGLYHSPLATPDRVDAGSVFHLASQARDLIRALATEEIPVRSADVAFADVFGLALLVHPYWMGWVLLALSLAPLGLLALRLRRAGALSLGRVGAGFAAGVALLVIAAVLLFAANLLSGAGAGYYDRLASTGWLELQALFICLGLALLLPRRVMGAWSGWLGLLLLIAVIAGAGQALAPASAPLLVWPLLAVSLLALAAGWPDPELKGRWTIIGLGVGGAVIAGFILYWAHFTFLAVGQDLPSGMALFTLLALAGLWPMLQRVPVNKAAVAAAIVLLAVGGGVAVKERLDPTAPEAARYKG